MRRWGGPARVVVGSLILIAVLFIFVFPSRSVLAQRRDLDRARQNVAVLRSENERIAEEAARLQTPAEIERIAREQYHMVFPGEQAFAVIPAPEGPAATTSTSTPAPTSTSTTAMPAP